MRKQAEHRVDQCPTCKGKGTLTGPKLVELTPEDWTKWQGLIAKEQNRLFWNQIIFCLGPILTVSTILFGLIYFPPPQGKSIFSSLGVITGMVTGIVLFLASFFFTIRLPREFQKLQEARREILALYGIQKNDLCKITNQGK